MSRILVFWSDHEIKMPQNGVFSLNREIKILHNSKVVQKVAKVSCLTVYEDWLQTAFIPLHKS